MRKGFTIGADPELFIINTNTNTVVSSIGLIPGEKGMAWRCKGMPKGFGLEIDNILAEFNIPPVTTKEAFINAINYMKNFIRDYVKKTNPDYDILCTASQFVPWDQLNHPKALEFGCSPDYNAYTESENEKPCGEKTNLRSAGFHIHIGYPKNNIETSILLVKYLDAYLGLKSVLIDKDSNRRNLYGKAGSFRLTPYGVEYRVLSSYMMSNDSILSDVWDGVESAINALWLNRRLPNPAAVQNAINNSDTDLANSLLEEMRPKANKEWEWVDKDIDLIKRLDELMEIGKPKVN